MSKQGLSTKQILSICNSDARMNFWMGAVRSGKTFSSILRLIDLIQNGPQGDAMICGVSRAAIQRNLLKDMFNLLGWSMPNENKTTMRMYGRDVHFVGAKDERAVAGIQGSTLAIAYVDELPKIPKSFFKMLQSRCSVPGAKIICTGNPEGPRHWVKREYIDSSDIDMKLFQFTLDDNPSLDDKYVANIKKEYSGVWYRRLILGEWAAADGMIYDSFDENNMFDGETFPPSYYIAGIDYGTSNATCCLLAGVYPKGFQKIRILKEYYYDSKEKMRCKTDSELAYDIYEILKNVPNLRSVYVDPSALSLRTELDRKGLPVEEADNDVVNGIKVVSSMIYNKQIVINKDCKNLIDSLYSYTWDEKAADRGEDAPRKEFDHACVIGTTLITMKDGSQKPIKDLGWIGQLLNFNSKNQKIEQDQYMNAVLTRKQAEIYELELEDGKKLMATGDHKIITKRGEVSLLDLTLSDIVLTCNTKFISEESSTKINPMDTGLAHHVQK